MGKVWGVLRIYLNKMRSTVIAADLKFYCDENMRLEILHSKNVITFNLFSVKTLFVSIDNGSSHIYITAYLVFTSKVFNLFTDQ